MSLTTRQGKGSKLTIQEMDGNLLYLEQLAQQGTEGPQGPPGSQGLQGPPGEAGDGLEGTQYVFVQANGTDTENAAELQAAYSTAQGMSPSGTNRITIVAAPGNYNFSSNFLMNTAYIDLVSLDGNRSVIFNGMGTLSISTNNTFVKGVDVLTKQFITGSSSPVKVENCKGGDVSFTNGTADYTNCEAGNNSFGSNTSASGVFTNCVAGANSFGYAVIVAGAASGIFTNCVGGNSSFGGGNKGSLTGKLYYCRLTSGTFQTVSSGGKTRLCLDGNDVENNQG
jgi:hypothetical protein